MTYVMLLCLLTVSIQHSSTQANRGALVEEASKAKITARSLALMEKQRKLAETLRQRAEAGDKGGDGDDGNAAEREKNWEWTIEDNDNWEKKKARKARRADYEFHGKLSFRSYVREDVP